MSHTRDMTTGSPLKAIILFALPLIIGNLFQHFYNLVDIGIVGNSLGDDAVSAVGATSALYGLFLCINVGVTSGFSLTTAKYYGAKDEERLKVSIASTLKLSAALGVLMTVFAVFATKPLLVLLKTPDLDLSYSYISIILLFTVFPLFYNAFSGILRAVGNSAAPFAFLIVGALSNIGMDFLFIRGLKLNVFGAGLATMLAQFISCSLSGIYLFIRCRDFLPKKEHFRHDKEMEKELMASGVSMGLMLSIVSIGSITLQYGVNSLGKATVTAHTTARKIDETMMLVFFPLSTAAATYGAGKTERIRKGIFTTFSIAAAVALIMIAVAFYYGEDLIRLLSGTKNEEIVRLGSTYLRFNIPFFFFLIILVILRNVLQGIGVKLVPNMASIVEMGVKVLVAILLVPMIGYYGVIFCEPVIWFVGSIIVGIGFIIAMRKKRIGNEIR